MTAPLPLPPCPVCGKAPREWRCADSGAWGVICSVSSLRASDDHEIYVVKPTYRLARAAWRRIAGGKQ